MTLSRLNNSPIRQYRPTAGTLATLALWEHYSIVRSQHPEHDLAQWAHFKVRYIVDNATPESVCVEHYNAADTGVTYFVPLEWISTPIGWEPRYTIHANPEQAQTIVKDWFARGISVRANHDLGSCMSIGSAFQPLDNSTAPHWRYPEQTDIIPPADCPRLIKVVSVEHEKITSATLGYPAQSDCPHCHGTGRRTIASLAEIRQETLATTFDRINKGELPLDDMTATDFRCHCHFGALSRMGRTKRAKLFKAMANDGWEVKYQPYAGGFWERIRMTTVHDWQ